MLILYIESKPSYLHDEYGKNLKKYGWLNSHDFYPEHHKTPQELYEHFTNELLPLAVSENKHVVVTVSQSFVNNIGHYISEHGGHENFGVYLANLDQFSSYDEEGFLVNWPYGYFNEMWGSEPFGLSFKR